MCKTFSFWIQLENVITDKLWKIFTIAASFPAGFLLLLSWSIPGASQSGAGSCLSLTQWDGAGMRWSHVCTFE